MSKIAKIIIRSAIKTHGRAKVRKLIEEYKATNQKNHKEIQLAFLELSNGGLL